MIIDSRFVNTTIRKANQLNYVIEDVEFILNLARDEKGTQFVPSKSHTLQNVKFEMSEYSNTTKLHFARTLYRRY